MQQYSEMLSNRNLQQPDSFAIGASNIGVGCGVRMLAVAYGMGMMYRTKQGLDTPILGFQGLSTHVTLNMSTNEGKRQSLDNVPRPGAVSRPEKLISSLCDLCR